MAINISKILLNDDLPKINFIEVMVSIWDELNDPHQSVEVRVFIDKKPNLTLDEIRSMAIQKGIDFLSCCIKNHQTECHK